MATTGLESIVIDGRGRSDPARDEPETGATQRPPSSACWMTRAPSGGPGARKQTPQRQTGRRALMHQTSPRHRSSRRRIAAGAALLAAAACTHAPRAPSPSMDDDPVVADGLRRLRAATAPYKDLDAAVAA